MPGEIEIFERLARIEEKQDQTNEHLKQLNGQVTTNTRNIGILKNTHLVIDGRNDVIGRIKAFLYTNGGSLVVGILTVYLIYKLQIGGG